VLGALIEQRLEAAGLSAGRRDGLGSALIFSALIAGDIDVYVSYSGTIWATQMKRTDVKPRQEVLDAVADWLKTTHGVRMLGSLGFEDAYALAMPRKKADSLGISSIADLAVHASQLAIASDYEFFERPEWKALRAAYRLNFRSQRTMQPDFMYQAAAAGDADVVVEAVFENLDVKRQLFTDLDRICRPGAVLASNTSAIPITQIAAATARPEAVVGTHFFSPVPMMALCELVRGYKTSDDTLAIARGFAEQVGKTCIVVNRDVAGFVTTRLIAVLANEAVRLLETGVATAQDIDTACRLGFGHAMGPLATLDLAGVDIMRHASDNIYADTRDPKFAPPELLSRMVLAGDLGQKAGQGFYEY